MYRPKYSNRPTTKYLTTETKILEWRLFMYHLCTTATFQTIYHKRKILDIRLNIKDFSSVGVTGFEPATTRPPDVYSNRTELRPDSFGKRAKPFALGLQI